MKKLFIYLNQFFKTLFRQLFNRYQINVVESENAFKKLDLKNKGIVHKAWKKFNARFFRKGMAYERFKRPCLFCNDPMFVSMGQLAFWHRMCRKEGRRLSLNARYGRV